jgi:YD repeat-containing protein
MTNDNLNRTVNIFDTSGTIATYTYNQLELLSTFNGNGTKTNYSYDNLERLTALNHTDYTQPIDSQTGSITK